MSATEDGKIPTPTRSKWGWAYWMVGIFLVFLGIVWGMEYARKQQGQAWIELVNETAYRPGDTIKGKAMLHAKKPLSSKHVTATVVFIKERDFGGAAESDITTVKHVLMTKVLTTNKIKFNLMSKAVSLTGGSILGSQEMGKLGKEKMGVTF